MGVKRDVLIGKGHVAFPLIANGVLIEQQNIALTFEPESIEIPRGDSFKSIVFPTNRIRTISIEDLGNNPYLWSGIRGISGSTSNIYTWEPESVDVVDPGTLTLALSKNLAPDETDGFGLRVYRVASNGNIIELEPGSSTALDVFTITGSGSTTLTFDAANDGHTIYVEYVGVNASLSDGSEKFVDDGSTMGNPQTIVVALREVTLYSTDGTKQDQLDGTYRNIVLYGCVPTGGLSESMDNVDWLRSAITFQVNNKMEEAEGV